MAFCDLSSDPIQASGSVHSCPPSPLERFSAWSAGSSFLLSPASLPSHLLPRLFRWSPPCSYPHSLYLFCLSLQLTKVFASQGLEKFGEVKEKFDPHLHDAMFEYADPDQEPGTLGQVIYAYKTDVNALCLFFFWLRSILVVR